MKLATIRIHLDHHRQRALQIEAGNRDAPAAYDANIGAYLHYLKEQAQQHGFAIVSDGASSSGSSAIFEIIEADHASKKAAHDWLESQPDIWNWIP